MTIIQINPIENGQHMFQSQSGRTSCWLDGWIAVPEHLVEDVNKTMGWCDLTIENGVLTGITPTTRPETKPEPTPAPSYEERLTALESAMMAMMTGGTGNV